jgi:hypothetical protein
MVLRKVRPDDRVRESDDPSGQRPATDLAAVAAHQPRVAGLGPLVDTRSEVVGRQVAEPEVRRDDACVPARGS